MIAAPPAPRRSPIQRQTDLIRNVGHKLDVILLHTEEDIEIVLQLPDPDAAHVAKISRAGFRNLTAAFGDPVCQLLGKGFCLLNQIRRIKHLITVDIVAMNPINLQAQIKEPAIGTPHGILIGVEPGLSHSSRSKRCASGISKRPMSPRTGVAAISPSCCGAFAHRPIAACISERGVRPPSIP